MFNLKTLFITLLLLTAASLGGMKAYLDHYVHQQVAQLTQQVAKYATIHYEQVDVSLLGNLTLKTLNIQSPALPTLKIATLSLSPLYQLYDERRFPEFLQLTIDNLEIPIPDTAPPPPWWLKMAKYDAYYVTPHDLRSLTYSVFQTNVTLQLQKQQQAVHCSLNIKSQQFGNWQLQTTLENVATLKQLVTAITTLSLRDASLDYTDNGLIPSIFKLLAQRNAMTTTALQQQLSQKLQTDLQRSGVKLDGSVINGLQNFIQTPQHIRVTLAPHPSITLNGLKLLMPENIPQRLNLQIPTAKSQ